MSEPSDIGAEPRPAPSPFWRLMLVAALCGAIAAAVGAHWHHDDGSDDEPSVTVHGVPVEAIGAGILGFPIGAVAGVLFGAIACGNPGRGAWVGGWAGLMGGGMGCICGSLLWGPLVGGIVAAVWCAVRVIGD
jgi:MFS family permease